MKIEAWVQIVYKIVQKEGVREQEERDKGNKPMCGMIGTPLLKPMGLSSAETPEMLTGSLPELST